MPTPIRQLNTQTHYLADGVTTAWPFSFTGGYIAPEHVKAQARDLTGLLTELSVDPVADLIGEFQLRVTPPVAAGFELRIYRSTPRDVPLVDFTDGSQLPEVNLDILAKQSIFVAAESADLLGVSTTEDLTALATLAGNAAAAASASQAGAASSATNAASSASAAATSATAAGNSATAAANSAAASASSATTVLTDLANLADSTKGAALPSFNATLNYTARTIGWALKKANPISAEWYLVAGATHTQAIQAAVNAAVATNWSVIIPGGIEWSITTNIAVTGPVDIAGMGRRVTRILANNCDGFTVSPGVPFVTIRDMTLAHSSRYTIAANTNTAISVDGTTASQCYWHSYRDLFIDGFEVGIFAGGVCSSTFRNVTAVYTHQGIDFAGQCLNNSVMQCHLGEQDNNVTVPASGSFGIRVGDGVINCEGIIIGGGTLCYGVLRGIHIRSSINVVVDGCILDMCHQFGVLAISTAGAGCFNNTIVNTYIGITGSAGDTGIYLANGYAPSDSQNRGTTVRDNEILAYPGSSLSYGILCDGPEEERNTISGNKVQGTTVNDCRITAGSGHRLDENIWRSTNGFSCTVPVRYGSQNVGNVSGPGLTYSASMTPDLSLFQRFTVSATNGSAFTINAPINDSMRNERDWALMLTIRNTSGGALGAATWNSIYKLSTWVQPANGFSRTITFSWNGTNYVESGRSPADVPN